MTVSFGKAALAMAGSDFRNKQSVPPHRNLVLRKNARCGLGKDVRDISNCRFLPIIFIMKTKEQIQGLYSLLSISI
jgi:hypothetical protein